MDELWRLTQTPALHEQWDLRFTRIEYLPRPDPSQPQRFLYETRIGFGARIAGEGESTGENHGPAGRVSALKFWSDDPKSLIRAGSGYWKYAPSDNGSIRFLTRYDYQTRFGWLGRAIDRLAFRSLLGWATAWSFDRLRLWIERGIDPGASMQRSVIHAIARITLALIWIYQGCVPKLLFANSSGELETLAALGAVPGHERAGLVAAGVCEIIFGLTMIVLWRMRVLFLVNATAMIVLAAVASLADPRLLTGQFNAATLNVAMFAIAVIGWIVQHDLPTSRACLRHEQRSALPSSP